MKMLVFSDTHGYLGNAKNVIEKIGKNVSCVIHLGDHDNDAKQLEVLYPNLKVYYVRGNNDYFYDTPYDTEININGNKILLTHGHLQKVSWNFSNISYWAEEKEADLVLFGHTHRPFIDFDGKTKIFSPGSISLPRSTQNPTFGIITISENGRIDGSVMEYENSSTFRLLKST